MARSLHCARRQAPLVLLGLALVAAACGSSSGPLQVATGTPSTSSTSIPPCSEVSRSGYVPVSDIEQVTGINNRANISTALLAATVETMDAPREGESGVEYTTFSRRAHVKVEDVYFDSQALRAQRGDDVTIHLLAADVCEGGESHEGYHGPLAEGDRVLVLLGSGAIFDESEVPVFSPYEIWRIEVDSSGVEQGRHNGTATYDGSGYRSGTMYWHAPMQTIIDRLLAERAHGQDAARWTDPQDDTFG